MLLCVDHSPNALKTAQYVVANFAWRDNMAITILGFIREPSGDVFDNEEEHEKARSDNEAIIAGVVEDARRTLLDGEFPEDSVTVKMIRLRRKSIAAGILEEQRRAPCHTVVVAGSKMSKTEEFILGNVAVKLVRESNCPVMTVY